GPRELLPAQRRHAHEDEPARLPDPAHHRLRRADGGELAARARAHAGRHAAAAARPCRAHGAELDAAAGGPHAGGALTMELEREAAAALGIPADVLAHARERRRDGRTLAETLADLGAADAGAFARALADAAGLPFAAAPPELPARELVDAV